MRERQPGLTETMVGHPDYRVANHTNKSLTRPGTKRAGIAERAYTHYRLFEHIFE